MNNAMKLKSVMKRIAKEKNISPQLVLQNYMHERFLERISVSRYKTNFIVKGGFLLASLVGLATRSTMDIDATIQGYPVTEDAVTQMINSIIRIELEDDVIFELKNIREIRDEADYSGYRVALIGNYQQMRVPIKVDITTGDAIIPCEISYMYHLMLEDRDINICVYSLSSILAEKLETIISRGDQSTRPRDYYDVYILLKLKSKNVNFSELSVALRTTAQHRGSLEIIKQYPDILKMVRQSGIMAKRWGNYAKDFDSISNLTFKDVCNSVVQILDNLGISSWR